MDGFRVIFALGYGAVAVLKLLLILIGLPQQLPIHDTIILNVVKNDVYYNAALLWLGSKFQKKKGTNRLRLLLSEVDETCNSTMFDF